MHASKTDSGVVPNPINGSHLIITKVVRQSELTSPVAAPLHDFNESFEIYSNGVMVKLNK